MKFSICIPNFNYERYLGRTLQSALDQTHGDLEVLVSDNASTDGSAALVKSFSDPRVRLRVNQCNVGFAGNLDRAAHLATGDYLIMLSSDDLMRTDALAAYDSFFSALGEAKFDAIVSSTWDVIDPDDKIIGKTGPDTGLWLPEDRKPELDSAAGGAVYGVPGKTLLKRCLLTMKNPFNFAATCYSREKYSEVEGYGGGRLYGPDKWFHWRMLGRCSMAYFIDRTLFAYRWHGGNQFSQQSANAALKYLVDEYVATMEIEPHLLAAMGMTKDDLYASFVEHDIARHGLATLARGERQRARRILAFGQAAYPEFVGRNRNARILRGLLALGPVGRKIATRAYNSYLAKSQVASDQQMLK